MQNVISGRQARELLLLLVLGVVNPLTSYPTSCGGACGHHACGGGGGGWKMSAHEVVTVCVRASHRRSRCCTGIDPPRASLIEAFRQRSGRRPRWVSRSCSGRRLWWRRRRWRSRSYSGMIVVRPYLLLCVCMFVCFVCVCVYRSLSVVVGGGGKVGTGYMQAGR